jgi:alpha-beta hydrolase superfamily lysophospholipase
MTGFEIREHYLDDPLLPKLFLQSWRKKQEKPQGCVLITHGLAEHSDCYDHLAKALAEQGWWVFA